jgi:hypothetical protein
MITSNNEMGGTVILADDCVPDSFTGTSHTHSEGKQTEHGHSVGVTRKEGLVDANTSEVVNVTWLSETDDGVNQHVGLASASSADSELPVRSVHRVSCLESDYLGPAELVEVQTELCRGVS